MLTMAVNRYESGLPVERGFEVEQWKHSEWHQTRDVDGVNCACGRIDYQRPDGTWGEVSIGAEGVFAVYIVNSHGKTVRVIRAASPLAKLLERESAEAIEKESDQ